MSSRDFSLTEAIRRDVGRASDAAGGERTIETITEEILHYQVVGGHAVVQIGKRLIEAKEMLPHGGWLPWLSEQVNYSERTAQRLMKIARECSNTTALSDLSSTKALALLALPEDDRKEMLETYDVPNMSTRELEDAIRERDEARRRAESAEKSFDEALKREEAANARWTAADEEAGKLRERVKELESRPVEVAVQVDEEAVKKAADEARTAADAEWSAKLKAAEEKLLKARETAKKAAEEAKSAGEGEASPEELEAARKAEAEAKAEAERLRAELEQAQKAAKAAAVAGDAEVSEFKLYFGLVQENVNKMRGLLLKVRSREDGTTGEKLTAALTALAEKVKEAAQ